MSEEKTIPAAEEPASRKRKKSVGDIIGIIINVILIIAIIIAALCTYVSFVSTSGNGVPNIFGMEIFSVQTDSMYPTLKSGDLVIDKAVKDTSALRRGDIITYWTIIDGERVLNTHRINEIYDGGGYLVFETKGDNNNAADTLTVHESEVVGVYSTHISGVGKALDYLQTGTGFLIVIVIPVALFFLYHLIQFFRVLFEYQNIKSRLKYQEELDARGVETDTSAAEQQEAPAVDKAEIEAMLREKIKAEMMAEMLAELKKQNAAQASETSEAAAPETQEPAVPAETEETASEEEDIPAETEETASEEEDAPAETEETASEEEDAPAETEETASEEEDAPAEAEETASEEDAPAETEEAVSEEETEEAPVTESVETEEAETDKNEAPAEDQTPEE